jgi:hypothetical protein
MPTGYTHNVVDGKITEFSEFALRCARAFGALITMRDDSMDAKISDEFKPEPYYQEKLTEAKETILKLQTMLPEDIEKLCQKECEEEAALNEKYNKNKLLENERLEAMEKQVLAWVPPSANHVELKSFMLDQINISKNPQHLIEKSYKEVEKTNIKDWHNEKLERAQKDIEYYTAEWKKEVERANSRTLWVKQLRESLK